jgi:hypothetical protein
VIGTQGARRKPAGDCHVPTPIGHVGILAWAAITQIKKPIGFISWPPRARGCSHCAFWQ